MKQFSSEISVGAALAVLLALLGLFAPSFYQAAPLLSLSAREAPTLIVTCGMALILIARQIDISVGSQFALCSVFSGLLFGAHWPWGLVLLASAALGFCLGAWNGFLVAALRLPSIVVTLATMIAWREALRWKGQGRFINLPADVQWFGLAQGAGQTLILAGALAIFGLGVWATKNLAACRFVYAIGSNTEAARLAGLRPQQITFFCFGLLGALTGIAALFNTVQSPQVDPKSGTGLELKCIAAAVVGGVGITGGRGTLIGAALGLVLLACISPALTHLHVEAYWERALQGIVILVAVMAERLKGIPSQPESQ